MRVLALGMLLLLLGQQGCSSGGFHRSDADTWDSLSFSLGTTYLTTGWYYESPDSTGVLFDWKGARVFVDPDPILTAGNMKEVELVESTFQKPSYDLLTIVLDDVGAERWSDATGLAIGGRLAGVIRGRLVSLALVNAQIDGGRTSFPLGEHGKHKNSGLLQVVRAESGSVEPVR